ncbi:hypothetical protein [Polyangium sp. 6x1]|uniref:hypothetical protein n=1 Tax=Polyangium sp. 6x1 TaxID=3042689 RepID=UPI00248241BF|nr:hypothetical protein [Polyangium sp. 6x1]MDI1450917.1 hypothetical protein [Polyangium sp. 6x1]
MAGEHRVKSVMKGSLSPIVLLFLCAACAACGSRQEHEVRAESMKDASTSWIGLTVGQVLAQCRTPDSELSMRDEPPGKLRGVEFGCHQGDSAKRVVLEFEYHTGLFSAERTWALEIVKAQRVIRVLEE